MLDIVRIFCRIYYDEYDDKKDESQMNFPKNSIARSAGPIIAILIAFISSGLIYLARTEQYKNWVSAPGVVLEIEIVYGGRRSRTSHRIYYAYSIDGTDYTGNNLYSGRSSDFSEGDSTEIWYNPDNPSESSFHKPGPGLDPYGPFFLAVPVIISFLLSNRRKKTTLR